MRNPAYRHIPLIKADSIECSHEENYWESLNKNVYKTAVEKCFDYLFSINHKLNIIGEIQAGSGKFLELINEYFELYDYKPTIILTEENENLRNALMSKNHDIFVYSEPYWCYQCDTIFAVECLPFLEDWKSKLTRLWNSMSVGSIIVIMDSQTPTLFRDFLKTLPDAVMIYNLVLTDEPAYINVEKRRRNLKIRMYKKVK